MSSLAKAILILFGLICCLQFVHMARLRRDGTSGKNDKTGDNSIDVNALSNMIMNRLKENLKDGGEHVKNILNSASTSLQQRGGVIRASVAALL